MNLFSKIVIPVFIVFVIFYGFKKKINIYESFLEGAKEGLIISFNIFPSIIAMVFAINIFLDSNFVYEVLGFLNPLLKFINIPIEIMPMAILRPISGTASLAIMNDIFINYGPDSYIGRLASVLQGCTDTTIYVLALYFSSIGIKKIKHCLFLSLIVDLIGVISSIVLVNIFLV